jgi:peptidoglycan/xylan/chitin deacetylase (PgdA/CDA1 family)
LASFWQHDFPDLDRAVKTPELESIRPAADVLAFGEGVSLLTRGGVEVRLSADPKARLALLPVLEDLAASLLMEKYKPPDALNERVALGLFYRLKRYIPRKAQLALRRLHARIRRRTATLRWPIDGTWVALAEAYLAICADSVGDAPLTVTRTWPSPFKAAAVVTHDVEGEAGQRRCQEIAAASEEVGLRGCFNFVAQRYPVDLGLMDALRQAGHEIGLHGIKHDGLKFSSRAIFEERLVQMARYREAWHLSGFRSPATHRKWAWMSELPFEWDSSYPDTDPFEPIAGGCGSPYPFLIGNVVELPITLPQDHTLWEIVHADASYIWHQKVSWLRMCGGLINLLVHPDYVDRPSRRDDFRRLLAGLAECDDVWHTLPRDIARWWRERKDQTQICYRTAEAGRWSLILEDEPEGVSLDDPTAETAA